MSSLPDRFNSTSAPEPMYLPPPTTPPLRPEPIDQLVRSAERIALALEHIARTYETQVRRG